MCDGARASRRRYVDREAELHYLDQCQAARNSETQLQQVPPVVRIGFRPLLPENSETPAAVEEQRTDRVTEPDPAWRAGGTTLQGYSSQQFMTADPIKVDHSKKVELVVRLVAREDEGDLVVFPKGEFKPLSTLHPPAVPE
ncbi:hypothetical protein OS493_007746 [Desmophyllum pertusum]|uniref:Uncharacterized protein n=1 Tax=Desmophyllum pertusum TaxID=174260 RepID=A0A9X0CNG0_9CNID|nr:hypothetical protein OS493_007746 [Desmophyllum pertusum]